MNQQPLPGASNVFTFGIIALVTSLVCCGPFAAIFSIIALSKAKKATQIYNDSPELYNDFNNVKTGKILAYIGLAIAIIMLILWILYFGVIIAMIASNGEFNNF